MLEYTALEDPASDFRLLRIHDAQKGGVVTATMHAFVRARAPSYAALSYTWGPKHPVVPITVNGTEILVRQNCRYALWQFFLHNSELLIWIDFICIDQSNNDEKSCQVGVMGDIFRSAQMVMVSLGAHEHDSTYSCAAIATLELRSAGPDWDIFEAGKPRSWQTTRLPRYWMPAETLRPVHWFKHLETFPHLARLRKSAEHLIRRPYWSRLWILQELSLARLIFVMCGSEIMLYDSIVELVETLIYKPSDGYRLRHEIFYTVQAFGYKPYSDSMFMDSLLRCIYPEGKRHIGEPQLFDGLLKLQCSDARDRIFGTISLIEWHDGHGIRFPDYTLRPKDIVAAILGTAGRQRRQTSRFVDTPRRCIELATGLAMLLEMTQGDLIAQSDNPLRCTESAEPTSKTGRYPAYATQGLESRNPVVTTTFALPKFCELMPSEKKFGLTMDGTYEIFWTRTLRMFQEFVDQELTMFPEEPRFLRLMINGKLAGLLSSGAEPGDVLQTILRRRQEQ